MPQRYFLLLLAVILFQPLSAQRGDTLDLRLRDEVHAVNPWVSGPLTLGLGYLAGRRADLIRDKTPSDRRTVEALDPADIPGIDRWAVTDQSIDNRSNALLLSDYMQNLGQSLPLAFLIWKKYRRNILDIGLMYFEAQTLQGLIYGYSPWGPSGTDRYRPFAYFQDQNWEPRSAGNERNSTYSGHVSTTSTGFFFVAKIIDDYNPQLTGGQRLLLYTGAFLPSAYSGYLRVRALKHFPTDSALGLAMGAFSGVIVPEIHRWWAKRNRSRLVAVPAYGNGAGGLALSLHF